MNRNRPHKRTQQPKPCQSCGKLIIFLVTDQNRKMPVNWESLSQEEQKFVTEAGEVDLDLKRHRAHFADCPDAKSFRRPR